MTDKVKEAAERLGAFAIDPTFPQGLKADINTVLSALRERGEALSMVISATQSNHKPGVIVDRVRQIARAALKDAPQ